MTDDTLHFRPPTRPLLLGASLLLCGLASSSALAQQLECDTDDDCGHGFMCEKGRFESCPTIAILCEEGQQCPPPPDCEPTEYASCVLAPCSQDGDCPDGMGCEAREGANQGICLWPWDLPCSQDSDCGEGFECVEAESCACSGSTGSDPEDGAEPAPRQEQCSCEPSGDFYCSQRQIACSDDSACPEHWTCSDSGLVACSSTPEDGSAPSEDACGSTGEKYCQPPAYSQGGQGLVTLEVASAAASGGPAANSTVADDSVAGSDGEATANDANASPKSSSGCQVGSGSQQLGWFALALLALVAPRRRSRKA